VESEEPARDDPPGRPRPPSRRVQARRSGIRASSNIWRLGPRRITILVELAVLVEAVRAAIQAAHIGAMVQACGALAAFVGRDARNETDGEVTRVLHAGAPVVLVEATRYCMASGPPRARRALAMGRI
jgi:hypothetical protein